jgi:hypothetical protein
LPFSIFDGKVVILQKLMLAALSNHPPNEVSNIPSPTVLFKPQEPIPVDMVYNNSPQRKALML